MTARSNQHPQHPRRSQDRGQDYHASNASDSTSTDDSVEPGRSSVDATPRPTPAPHPKTLGALTVVHDTNTNVLRSSPAPPEITSSSSRRLNFFGDPKPSSNNAQPLQAAASTILRGPIPAQLLPPRTHSRADSAVALSRESTASPLPSVATSSALASGRPHGSPSKGSSVRTYDAKLVTREMHRLGNLAHLPSALGPTLSAATSATTLALPSQGGNSTTGNATTASGENSWETLHVHVLPLFVGEPLRIPIEDLNTLVNKHIQSVLSQSPARALVTLENDASDLLYSGMYTLNAKFVGVDEEKLVGRAVEIWGFFWDQVLPYVEGVLLPLQTDPLLSSLYRTPKTHRTSSPTRQTSGLPTSSQLSATHIDVRTVALRSFRDNVILPLYPRLMSRLTTLSHVDHLPDYQQPRLQQMLLVLGSLGRQCPTPVSLTSPAPAPTAGEAAVSDLLRVVRSPRPQGLVPSFRKSRVGLTQSFLSEGKPRDRRGRVEARFRGRDSDRNGDEDRGSDSDGVDGDGAATPRMEDGKALGRPYRQRDSLEVPSLYVEQTLSQENRGGWGLGVGNEDSGSRVAEEDDEEESLNLDQAQD